MKTLMQKAGGSFQLARRFVGFISEKRRLELRIEMLRQDAVYYRGEIARQRAQLTREADRTEAIDRADRLHESAQELIEDAHELLQRLHKGQRIAAWQVRNWRVDYLIWKRESDC